VRCWLQLNYVAQQPQRSRAPASQQHEVRVQVFPAMSLCITDQILTAVNSTVTQCCCKPTTSACPKMAFRGPCCCACSMADRTAASLRRYGSHSASLRVQG
jgi:hypothetical protein